MLSAGGKRSWSSNIISKYGKDCFKITDNYVLVTLPYDKEVLNKIGNVRLNVRLNATQQAIVEFLKINPKLNAQDIADELKKSKKTIERDFIELQQNDIISRAGSKRDGYWIVIG